MSLLTKWTKHLGDKEKKEEFQSLVKSSKPVLDRLVVLLEEELNYSRKTQNEKINYNSPSWPMLQADFVGEQRTLLKIIRLISLEDNN